MPLADAPPTVGAATRPPAPLGLELAAAALVPTAAYSFIKVFALSSALLPIIGAALLSSAVAVAMRRLRFPLVAAAGVSFGALSLLLASRYAPDTLRLNVLPTRDTITTIESIAQTGIEDFRELKAPVGSSDAFIAATMAAAWVMSFLTDWGALRLRLAFEPVLPAGLLFVFASVLGAETRQIFTTVVFASAVIIWALTQRTFTLARRGTWLSADRRRGPSGLAKSGAAIAALAMLLGIVVGPRLPGAEASGLYSWRGAGNPTRVVVSPYASIGSRLVTQQDVTMFTVVASSPAYWRLAGLDTYNFDDGYWQTKSKFKPEEGGLDGQLPSAGTTVTIEQTFTIDALAAIWLPAAFAPANLVSSDAPATWNADESALTVNNSRQNSDGLSYTIESVVPLFTAEELNAASASVPQDIADRYLGLDEGLTPRIATEALAITAGATTRYEQMMALQRHFQGFDYSIRLGPRGEDPIETFLNERVGFCQQFSGTFALMARSLGAPARVAVGFTWGDLVEGTSDTYRVTGRQAHAWPEVWFEGLGWVAFEPTPGRGAPGATYTNTPAMQDSPDDPSDVIGPTPTTAPASPLNRGEFNDFDPDLGASNPTDLGGSTSRNYKIPWRWLALPLALVIYGLGMPLLDHSRRLRRRKLAQSGPQRIQVAWAEASEDLDRGFGLARRGAETRSEFARRAGSDRRVQEQELRTLARVTTEARYRPEPIGAGAAAMSEMAVAQAQDASAAISERVKERVPWQVRWRRQLDPRQLYR